MDTAIGPAVTDPRPQVLQNESFEGRTGDLLTRIERPGGPNKK